MKTLKRIGLVALFAAAVLAVLSFTPWGPVKLVRVVGVSMEPTLREGDWLLCVRRDWNVGDVVVARDGEGFMVKRVRREGQTGHSHWSLRGRVVSLCRTATLLGDNTWNSEARQTPTDRVQGVVVYRLRPWNQGWREANGVDWNRHRILE